MARKRARERERASSCLYLWQANRLIKGGHVCFCARYLALSKHCLSSLCSPHSLNISFPIVRHWRFEANRAFLCKSHAPNTTGRHYSEMLTLTNNAVLRRKNKLSNKKLKRSRKITIARLYSGGTSTESMCGGTG